MTDPRRPVAPHAVPWIALLLCAANPLAHAQGTAPAPRPELAVCAAILEDRIRLDCYDRALGRAAAPQTVPPALPPAVSGANPPAASGTTPPTAGAPAPSAATVTPGAPLPARGAEPGALAPDERARLARDARRALGSTLGERWELDPSTKQGRFLLRPYRPMYLLPARWSDAPNQRPTSDGEGNSVAEPQNINALEGVFQISLKSKIWETIGGSNVDLWLAYTQKSHWQVYTPTLSRPFRETNYEPEVFAIRGIDQPLALGWRARFVGIGIDHQSNGRAEPLSRSWNRIVAQAGLERGDWSVLLRPWWRLPEKSDDDNPGIENWIGRGEMIVTRRLGAQQFSVQLRHSMRGGEQSRGSVLLDWAYPLSSYLKGHLQVFSGYGESLIDYNHRQTTIGLGFSLVEWQ